MTDKLTKLFLESVNSADSDDLTKHGRWLALSYKLKLDSFREFCAFSEIYVMQRTMSKKSDRFFGTPADFYERFSLLYGKRTLFHIVAALKNKRLITQQGKNKFTVPGELFQKLLPYDDDFFSNVEWQQEIGSITEQRHLANSDVMSLGTEHNGT